MKNHQGPFESNQRLIAGVDEAGRGPLAGPVVAVAVILDPNNPVSELKDSKKISAPKRMVLAEQIKSNAISWGIGRVDNWEIDRINILQASLLAMTKAVAALKVKPDHVVIDGNQCPKVAYSIETIVKGDETVPSISAASILAKVLRDQEMMEMDSRYPGYGFAQHKGYPTKDHLSALAHLGICEIHRRSYAPVMRML